MDDCRHRMYVVVAAGLQYQVCRKCALSRVHDEEKKPIEMHPAYSGGPLSPVWDALTNPQRHIFYMRYLSDIMVDVERLSQSKAMQLWGIKSHGTMYELTKTARSQQAGNSQVETFPVMCGRRRQEYQDRLDALVTQRTQLDSQIQNCETLIQNLDSLIKAEAIMEEA